MSNESKFVPLKSLAHVITKGSTPTSEQGYTEEGINFIRALSIDENGQLDEKTFLKISKETHENLSRSVVEKDDVLISIVGEIGRGALATTEHLPANLNQQIAIIRPNKSMIYPRYLANLLRTHEIQHLLSSLSIGSVQDNLNLSDLRNLKIEKLPLDEQLSRNKLLELIEDKNSSDSKISDIYGTLISSLFRSWFIDFDPVKAKAEGNLPYGMNEETAALFPDTFEDSELGPIPTGWRIQYLADLYDIQRGFSYTGASLCEQSEGMAMINLASFVEGGGYKHTGLKHISSEFKEKFYIKRGDVFIATVDLTPELRVVGSPLIAPSSLENESIFSQDLLRLRNKTGENIDRGFLFHWLKIRRGILKKWSSGTTVSRFPPNALNKYPILIPPREILQHFENIFEHTQEFSELSKQKMSNLSLTRDSLLPRLMSGELSVS